MRGWFIILSILCFGSLSAQVVTVIDAISGQPVDMVKINGSGSERSFYTNEEGKVDISELVDDPSISFFRSGYDPQTLAWADLKQNRFTITFESREMDLNEIVVSASRHEQEKRNVPQRITTIRPSQMAFQQPQTTADMLGQTGQVQVQKSQLGGGSPMIRGFAANRVLIVVDGVRMNNAIFRSGNLQNVIAIDALALQEAEVLFGPGSIIYGSDAIGGVMDFHTVKPLHFGEKGGIIGQATLRSGSANFEKTGHLHLNYGKKDWSGITSYTFSDFDDQAMGLEGPTEYLRRKYVEVGSDSDRLVINPDATIQKFTGYHQHNFIQKVRYAKNKWDINYGFHYSTTSDVPRYDRLIEPDGSGGLRNAEWYYGPQEWMMHNLRMKRDSGNVIYDQFVITAAYQRFKESRHSRRFNRDWLREQFEQVDVLNFNADFTKELWGNTDIFYGAEIVTNSIGSRAMETDIRGNGGVADAQTRYPDGASWNSLAFYTSVNHRFNDKFSWQLGGRYQHHVMRASFDTTFIPLPFTDAELSNGALTGSAGFVYMPDSTWRISLNGAAAFRAPNVDDLGKVFDSEPGNLIVPNGELKPEYAYNGDVSISKVFGDLVKVEATGFYTYLTNALVRRDFSLNGEDSVLFDGEMSNVQAIQNASQAYVYGFQGGIDIDLPFDIGVSSHFNWQRGYEVDSENDTLVPLRHAGPWFGVSRIYWQRSNVRIELNAQYAGTVRADEMAPSEISKDYLYAIDENGDPYSPGWYTLNLKASWRLNRYLMMLGGVENITNRRYRTYSSGIAAPGTHVYASLKVTF